MEEFEKWFKENESIIYKYQLTDKQLAWFAWISAKENSNVINALEDEIKSKSVPGLFSKEQLAWINRKITDNE